MASLAGTAEAEPAPGPYTTLEANQIVDFRYSFPTIAGSYPALLAHIRADRAKSYSEAVRSARDDAQSARQHKFPFHQHQFWRDWTLAGDAYPLLSLQSHADFYTGGAHPNHVSSALLWDEKKDWAVEVDRLFGGPGKLWSQIRTIYCRKLDQERARRQISSPAACPERKELTIVPADTDFNHELDTLRIIADPYVAGAYVEGAYVVSLPVTPGLLTSIDPPYQSAFEVQRQ